MKEINILRIASSLLTSLLKKDFIGFDPYDIKAHPFILKLIAWGNKSYPLEIIREIILEVIQHYPQLSRTLLRIKPTHNSKALGLIGTACAELSLLDDLKTKLISSSRNRINDLLENYKVLADSGTGWGYPFDWQSHQLIPANTPNGIVTTAVGEYFWTQYKISGDREFLNKCEQICIFLNNLPTDQISSDKICFSYIPHYQNHVHNLNLFVADFLIKTGIEVGRSDWIEKGNNAINYTIADQLPNGAFDYNGPPEKPQSFIDNYHTGFVLRMLGSCYHYTKRDDVRLSLEKGLKYYIDNFFTPTGAPKFKPDSLYKIDIHSAAEAINCLIFLEKYHKGAFSKAKLVLNWTLENLYDPDHKNFHYAILKSRFTGRIYRSEIKYLRWSQAWMMRALSRYLLYSSQGTIII